MMVPHVLFNIFDVPVCTINFHFIQTVPLETSFSQLMQSRIAFYRIVESNNYHQYQKYIFILELGTTGAELIKQNRLDCCTCKATLPAPLPPPSFTHKCDDKQPYLFWSFGQLVMK